MNVVVKRSEEGEDGREGNGKFHFQFLSIHIDSKRER
tara:strand:- start:495 stop:605 length:111 start_codon:yes stop_codon:yes gene_type:complete